MSAIDIEATTFLVRSDADQPDIALVEGLKRIREACPGIDITEGSARLDPGEWKDVHGTHRNPRWAVTAKGRILPSW